MAKPKVKFYSVQMRKSFRTDDYVVGRDKRGRSRLEGKDSEGNRVFRYVSEKDVGRFK